MLEVKDTCDFREDMAALVCAVTCRYPQLSWYSTAEMYLDAERFYIYFPYLSPWQAPAAASREEADAVLLASVGTVLREGVCVKVKVCERHRVCIGGVL